MTDSTFAVVLASATFAVVYVAVGIVREYALRRGVLDIPQARSSHVLPTPRGGGLGLLIGVVGVAAAASHAARVSVAALAASAGAVVAVAAVGWWDDHRPVGVRVRLGIHVLAAMIVATLADVALSEVALAAAPSRALWFAWWAVWTVSAINVVNFMDGIDGIIGGQLVVYGAYVALMSRPGGPAFALGLALAAGAAAFLCWNWAPARIFLGDVGSGPSGVLIVLAGVALLAEGGVALPRAYLPLYPLFLDAAVTLARRWRAGERVTTPHRSHLYQRLANGPWTHRSTALAFSAAAAAGAICGALGTRTPSAGSTVLVAAYLVGVPLVGRRLEIAAPWRPSVAP